MGGMFWPAKIEQTFGPRVSSLATLMALEAVAFDRRDCCRCRCRCCRCCRCCCCCCAAEYMQIFSRAGRSPQHITHEHTEDVLATPPHCASHLVQSLCQVQAATTGLSDGDFLRRIPSELFLSVFQEPALPAPAQVDAVVPLEHTCPYCAQMFDNLGLLHRHLAKRHKAITLFRGFLISRDSIDGKPQCRHCQRKFAHWVGLVHHVEHDSSSGTSL